jgi:hypothetical protein
MKNDGIQGVKKLFTLKNPANNEILLTVKPIGFGSFGVYGDGVLIAFLPNKASADAHCQRLIKQQDNEQKQVKQIQLSSETLLSIYNVYFGL